ncbi:hypothetical protein EPYR_02321 [Erwinia pyrifoliae DSM 12163]|nr:hypothetical protein EPYR_02321 [Erwinia pyrifoliae DSM 12163]
MKPRPSGRGFFYAPVLLRPNSDAHRSVVLRFRNSCFTLTPATLMLPGGGFRLRATETGAKKTR